MSNELKAVVQQSEALRAELRSQCAGLPSSVVNMLLSKCSVNGAIPVTLDDLKALLSNAVNQMRLELRDTLPHAAAARASGQPVQAGSDARFQVWQWGGQLHPVPEGWRLPRTDVMAVWRLWYFGSVADRIAPLRTLRKWDLRRDDTGKADSGEVAQWSKTNGVMMALTAQMVGMGLIATAAGVGRLSEDQATAAFSQAIVPLMEKLKPGATQQPRGRWVELSMSTLYKHVRKRKRAEAQLQRHADEAEGSSSVVAADGL
jgi:hypothetical protein